VYHRLCVVCHLKAERRKKTGVHPLLLSDSHDVTLPYPSLLLCLPLLTGVCWCQPWENFGTKDACRWVIEHFRQNFCPLTFVFLSSPWGFCNAFASPGVPFDSHVRRYEQSVTLYLTLCGLSSKLKVRRCITSKTQNGSNFKLMKRRRNAT